MNAPSRIPRPSRPGMSRSWPRPGVPRVAGVAGGVGTTTLAAALGGHDCGPYPGTAGSADVLVCRASADMLLRASTVVDALLKARQPRPVLAVVLGELAPDRAAVARLGLISPHVPRIVHIPHVRRWGRMHHPLDEARALPAIPAEQVPRHLRTFAASVTQLRAAAAQRPVLTPAPARSTAARTASRPASHRPLGRSR